VLGSTEKFRAAATRRGGFQRSKEGPGALSLGVAPAHGALITAQGALDDELVFYAAVGDEAQKGARLFVKLEGAEPPDTSLLTDDEGRARLRVRPTDAYVRVELKAELDALRARLAARFEVARGAIRATKLDDRLRLESSGAASAAYVAFFDEKQRWGGARVPLTLAADGHLVGELAWPANLSASPLWVVTSSQPDLASDSAVGWAVRRNTQSALPTTFDARELLLLDGAPPAQAREARRTKRIRFVTAAYASLALLITLYLFVRHVRAADARFEQHLTSSGVEGVPSIAPPRKGRAVLAAACIGLGFVVLVVFALLKD
jgi:hypothetical protein